MKKREDKDKDLARLRAEFEKAQSSIFLTGYEKMTVQQDFELRKAIRGAGGHYRVVKNNLAEKAAEGTPAANLMKDLKGMTSMAWTEQDPVALAKTITTFARTTPAFTFRAGLVQGRVVDMKGVQDLSTMPSKEQLYANLLFLINASAQRLVTAISGVGRNLAVVVDQGVKENKFSE
jgi:large subunit ribosomal protein L10